MTRGQQRLKRWFDLVVGTVLLLLFSPVLLILSLCSSLDTGKPGWFSQDRIGRYGKPFRLYKLRTLRGTAHHDIVAMHKAGTRFGRFLRSSKLDELPQLIHVVGGSMSLVGPRPDIPGYADLLEGDDRQVLELRPGISGPASIKYRREDQLLLKQPDPNWYNDHVIWPDKVKINKAYYQNWSLWSDLGYLWTTVFPNQS